MVLTERDRVIVIIIGAIVVAVTLGVGVFLYAKSRQDITDSLETVSFEAKKADTLDRRQKQTQKIWKQMLAAGLSNDTNTAESQLEKNLEEWAQESGVNVIQRNLASSTIQSAKNTPEGKFHQIGFHMTGTGPLSTLAKLLWRIEKSPMPIRVADVQIQPRNGKEGQDDLQFQLSVSTLCLVNDSDKNPRSNGSSDSRGGDQ